MKKIPITEASDAQLREFAKTVQQIDKVPAQRGPLIAAILQSGWQNDYIITDTDQPDLPESSSPLEQHEEPEETVSKMPLKGFGFWKNSPMVHLRIMSTDRPGGNEPAHPSINGSPPLVIQRNILVEVPYDFYLDLKQAGGTKVIPGASATDELVRQDYKEYPMEIVKMPTREEIAKWQEHTSKMELGHPKAAAA
jgi:hypothetical protein